ncbi:hypothetical protein DS62_00845 [Smithella sp. SC_K08D17]|nr:hypothetical protein KD27_07120 [Smithella sp. D17]KIE17756.1 hypothetical protein DS62_00845 [Smithella sp. SC_K08D17]
MASGTHKPSGIATWPEDNAYMNELHPNRLVINHEHSALLSIYHAQITFFLAMFSRSCNMTNNLKNLKGSENLYFKNLIRFFLNPMLLK